MGTIVKGQSRAILPVRFPRRFASSVHCRLSVGVASPQASQFCLPLIRSPQPSPRLHCIVRLQGCNLCRAVPCRTGGALTWDVVGTGPTKPLKNGPFLGSVPKILASRLSRLFHSPTLSSRVRPHCLRWGDRSYLTAVCRRRSIRTTDCRWRRLFLISRQTTLSGGIRTSGSPSRLRCQMATYGPKFRQRLSGRISR